MSDGAKAAPWDGRPPHPERNGYHWLRRIDNVGPPMIPVIWTWRADAQVWRWRGGEMTAAEQAETKEYLAPVTSHHDVDRLRARAERLVTALGMARCDIIEGLDALPGIDAALVLDAEPQEPAP